MANGIFREKSLDGIRSPEQLNDYLRVTNPAVWLILAAVILLLAGMLVWSASASIDSVATGNATVRDGVMTVHFQDGRIAESVEAGMTITVGETTQTVTSVGTGADGALFALADTTLADGSYPAGVLLRRTQVLRLLFN